MFSKNEVNYLKTQRLVRFATVSDDGQPDVSPLGYEFDGQYLYVGGRNPTNSRKYKNVRNGYTKVALVIDDVASVDPWKPRGIRLYGTADFITRKGMFGEGTYLRITPITSWSWGIEEPVFVEGQFRVKKTAHKL